MKEKSDKNISNNEVGDGVFCEFGLIDAVQDIDDQMIYNASQPWKVKEKSKIITTKFKIACVLFLMMLGIGMFNEQIQAAMEPAANKVYDYIYHTKDLSEYTEFIGKVYEDKGFRVTINEIVLDEDCVKIDAKLAYAPDSPNKPEDFNFLRLRIKKLKYGRKSIDYISQQFGHEVELREDEESGFLIPKPVNKGILMNQYYIDEKKIPKDVTRIKIVFCLFDTLEDGTTRDVSEFVCEFKTDKDKICRDAVTSELNANMITDTGITMHLTNIKTTEVASRMIVECSDDLSDWIEYNGEREYGIPNYYFSIEDEFGNVEFLDMGDTSYIKDCKKMVFQGIGGVTVDSDSRFYTIKLYRQDLYEQFAGTIDEVEPVDEIVVEVK